MNRKRVKLTSGTLKTVKYLNERNILESKDRNNLKIELGLKCTLI